MDKQTIAYYPTSNTNTIELLNTGGLTKTAGIADDIVKFLETLQPKPDKTYALINALSAGEFYSSNLNGDWFPEDELLKHYKSFEDLGYIYELHKNKDPNKSLGKVLFAFYNPNMHRVELVVEFDNARAAHVLEKIKDGQTIATSMGTRVAYEKCSICGHVSKTLAQRCDHLKYEMNKIYPDGRKVFAYNYRPKFFDISVVRIPADKTSRIVRVVSIENKDGKRVIVFKKRLENFDKAAYEKAASMETTAEINKEIPVKVEQLSSTKEEIEDLKKLVKDRLDDKTIAKLAEYPLNESLSTLLTLGIVPTPEDFQKLALFSLGEKELALELEKTGSLFNFKDVDKRYIISDVSINNANEKIASILAESGAVEKMSNIPLWDMSRKLMKIAKYNEKGEWYPDKVPPEERSYLSKLFFSAPEEEPKKDPTKNPVLPLSALASMYYGYLKAFKNEKNMTEFSKAIKKYPWLLPILVGGASYLTVKAQETYNESYQPYIQGQEKTSSLQLPSLIEKSLKSGLVAFPLSYFMSGTYENKARKGKELGSFENFVRKHPALMGILGTFIGNKLQKTLKTIKKVDNDLEIPYIFRKTAELLINSNEKVLNNIKTDLTEVVFYG